MTKKQFYTDGQYVMQDGGLYVICNGEHDADVVATALNELLDKNEELKELRDYFERKKYEYHNKWNLAHLDNINLRKENEQLKKDLKKKFVPFAKADGDYTAVNTEEFIKILNENEQLKQEVENLHEQLTHF